MSCRRPLARLWVVGVALALPAPSVSAQPEAPAPAAATSEITVTATARVAPRDEGEGQGGDVATVRLGEPATLTLDIEGPAGIELIAPDTRVALGDAFVVLRPLAGQREVGGGRQAETHRYEVLPVRMGAEKIRAIEVPWRAAEGEAKGVATTEPVTVWIRGHLTNEAAPRPGPAPEPVPIVTTNWLLIWALSIGGALLLAGLLTFLVLTAMRERFEAMLPGPPPRPADEVALERLDALDGASDAEMPPEARQATAIDILREYIEGRYEIDALEMTSRELLQRLGGVDLKGVALDDIRRLFDDADLVKFARITPAPEDARANVGQVRDIVELTWEPPAPPEPEEDEVPRLEPATLRQRLYAGALDAGVVGGLGLIVFGALWVTGNLAFGWTSAVLVAFGLLGRDAFSRSPGKRALNLSVARRDDTQGPASPNQRLYRNVPFLLWPITASVEVLVLRHNPLRLRLGDLLAGTEVVQGEAAGRARRRRRAEGGRR